MTNQNPEQIARDRIDNMLKASGWAVQNKSNINFNASSGIAIKEYQTDIGPGDYVLFVDREPCGIIEAKREEEGHRLTTHEDQAEFYAESKLKWITENKPLPFIYESTGILTRFTDKRNPKPRAHPVFSFHKPETFSRPLERNPTVPLKDLLYSVMMGADDEDTFTTLANRLTRLEKQITPEEREKFSNLAQGKTINKVVHELLDTYDPDKLEEKAKQKFNLNQNDIPQEA